MLDERMAPPPEDGVRLEKFEVEFNIPVWITSKQYMQISQFFHDITSAPWNQPCEGVHWLAGQGSKPKWSAPDAMLLGKRPEPNPEWSGEPTFDDSIMFFETCAREFASEKERERVMARRAKAEKEK